MSKTINNHSARHSNGMSDLDEDNSLVASTMDNDMSILTAAKRAPPNLASDWPSANCAEGDWIDHGMDNDDDQDDSDDPAEQEQFNRISGILSQLILEANNAINSPSSLTGRRTSTPTMIECEDDDDDYVNGSDNDNDNDNDLMEPTPGMEDDAIDYLDWCAPGMDDILSEAGDNFSNMDEDTPVRSASPLPIQLPLYKPHVSNSTTTTTTTTTMMERAISASTSTTAKDSRRRSRLPRPKKLSLDIIQQYHHHHHPPPPPSYHNRSSSTMSASSSSSSLMDYDDDLFSPLSSSLTTPMSRTISPLLFEKGLYTQVSRQGSTTSHETDLAILCGRALQNHQQNQHPLQRDDDSEMEDGDDEYASHRQGTGSTLLSSNGSLLASFERLDSSLAIVDSLSRDLANYRRQRPRQRSSPTDIHVMTATTSHCSVFTDPIVDSPISAHPLEETATASITTPSDDNTYAAYQHYDRRSSGDRQWLTILLVGPILYIPYLLMASLWEQIIVATESTTPTAPFSLLLSSASAMMFDDRHTFASLKSTLITTITSTTVIGDGDGGGGGDMVPPCIGLAVFLLFLAILHLLKGDCATIDQDQALVADKEGRQLMDTSSYHDLSNTMIRRSSLPMLPCSPSMSRRNSF